MQKKMNDIEATIRFRAQAENENQVENVNWVYLGGIISYNTRSVRGKLH